MLAARDIAGLAMPTFGVNLKNITRSKPVVRSPRKPVAGDARWRSFVSVPMKYKRTIRERLTLPASGSKPTVSTEGIEPLTYWL